jgi:hypothetical protein
LTWQIQQAGKDYVFSETLRSLERHRATITPFSGLHHPMGIGSRHNCDKIWLTGQSAPQEATTFRNAVSCDQLMAEVTSSATRIASLELSVARGSTATLACSREGVPLPADDNPRTVFNRLFGVETGGIDVQRRRIDRRRSVLDLVLENVQSTRASIGSSDRIKLDDYLESVRDVEKRAERLESWLDVAKPKVDAATTANLTRNIPKTDAGVSHRHDPRGDLYERQRKQRSRDP